MTRPRTPTGLLIDVVGEIDIAGHPATVSWPRAGDGVGIDFIEFAEGPARYGVVLELDSDPRLRVEPDHAALLDVEERLIVLEQVAAIWYRVNPFPEAAWRRGFRP
ncbi:hypothetical protein L0U85_12185 [Glycomyces sp. L485]|uniref:hypothetical protein n=1 Tax=Glycomyces sp. L485 TaxID=2909235 RepID=UPI001F4B92E2|nr:hypothetical protein [Glycomyces sp. L485]MCH7231603.1 hypothetical protein [Glycomyces sp. L485]